MAVDDDGWLDVPAPVPGDPSLPRFPHRSSDPALGELHAAEVQKAISVGAIVPLTSGAVHDTSRKWHSLFSVWRSCGHRVRLISDLRPTNASLPVPPSFSLPSPADATWADANWAAKVDLEAAFWSVRAGDRLARAMSLVLPDGTPAEWRSMPFGLSWAPFFFDALLNPLITFLRAVHPRCRFHKYLDDVLVTSPDHDSCAAGLADLRRCFGDLGFVVSDAKSDDRPRRVVEFLGVILDFERKECSWPLRHATAVADLASSLDRPRVHLLQLQRFLGKLAFLCQLCPVLAVWRRAIDDAVAAHLAADRAPPLGVDMTDDARAALRWWAASAVRLSQRSFPWPTGERFVVRCDASEWAGGVTIICPDGSRRRITVLLPPHMVGASSGAREYHVAIRGLEYLRVCVGWQPLMRAAVDLYTDSQASAGALARGARAPPMREDGRRLLDFTLDTGARVRPVWLPRERLAAEDAGSRRVLWSDASLHGPVFDALCDWAFGRGVRPELDAFATGANARAAAWLSMVDESGAAGVDGLRAPWSGRVYAYPPAALAARARVRAVAETAASSGGAVRTVLLVGPADAVSAGAVRTHALPAQCVVLPPGYDGLPVQPPVTLVAAVFEV